MPFGWGKKKLEPEGRKSGPYRIMGQDATLRENLDFHHLEIVVGDLSASPQNETTEQAEARKFIYKEVNRKLDQRGIKYGASPHAPMSFNPDAGALGENNPRHILKYEDLEQALSELERAYPTPEAVKVAQEDRETEQRSEARYTAQINAQRSVAPFVHETLKFLMEKGIRLKPSEAAELTERLAAVQMQSRGRS